MLLKPWAEVPVSRYLLDENDDLSEAEAAYLLAFEPWTKVDLGQLTINQPTVVLFASKLSGYVKAISGVEKVGSLSTGVTRIGSAPPVAQLDSDIYGDDLDEPEQEDLGVRSQDPIYRVNSNLLISVPVLEPVGCYEFARQILALSPANVVAVAPASVNATSPSVYELHSTASSPVFGSVPLLPPPSFLSGPIASVLSQCERVGVKANVLCVRAEGPSGHEVLDSDAYDEVQTLLGPVLDVTVAKLSRVRDSLYL